MGADEDEAALVSVPPYHIAGISAILVGPVRRAPHRVPAAVRPRASGCDVARDEGITHAMVVPTMLGRILDVLEAQRRAALPALQAPLLRRRPHAAAGDRAGHDAAAATSNFVNAYGLTETSSTIAVLGPDDHRDGVRQRRPRGAGPARLGRPAAARRSSSRSATPTGEPWCRSASRARSTCGASRSPASTSAAASSPTTAGSRPATAATSTRTASSSSRAASTTSSCAAARTCRRARSRTCCSTTRRWPTPAVVGVPDDEWGEVVAAAVVLHAGHDGDRGRAAGRGSASRLRSSRTPERDRRSARELPYNETGKLLRRVLRTELATEFAPTTGCSQAALAADSVRPSGVAAATCHPGERAIPPPARARARGARPPVDDELRPPPLPDRGRRAGPRRADRAHGRPVPGGLRGPHERCRAAWPTAVRRRSCPTRWPVPPSVVRSASTLVFVYPTWWFGVPAVMKGWLERVLVPGVAFTLDPETKKVRRNMGHVRRIVGVTTYGSSPLAVHLAGDGGRRTLGRTLRLVAHPLARTTWLGLYGMDTATDASAPRSRPGSRSAWRSCEGARGARPPRGVQLRRGAARPGGRRAGARRAPGGPAGPLRRGLRPGAERGRARLGTARTLHPARALDHARRLRAAEALVLVHPTWWGGQPAILKGWFDRVWAAGVAFTLVPGSTRPRAGLRNLRRLVVVTTHGSSKWTNALQGEPGKHLVGRGLRPLCHPLARTRWIALYGLDRVDAPSGSASSAVSTTASAAPASDRRFERAGPVGHVRRIGGGTGPGSGHLPPPEPAPTTLAPEPAVEPTPETARSRRRKGGQLRHSRNGGRAVVRWVRRAGRWWRRWRWTRRAPRGGGRSCWAPGWRRRGGRPGSARARWPGPPGRGRSTRRARVAVPGCTATRNHSTHSSGMPRSTTLAVAAPVPAPMAAPASQPTGPPSSRPKRLAHTAPDSAAAPGLGSIVSRTWVWPSCALLDEDGVAAA